MKILHIVPDYDNPSNGIAVAAKKIIDGQKKQGHTVYMDDSFSIKRYGDVDCVVVHSMWSKVVLGSCFSILRAGKKLIRMPHGCLDPVRLKYHAWKKKLLFPVERFFFKKSFAVLATSKAEKEWIESWCKTERIVVAPLGIDELKSTAIKEVEESLPKTFLYVGRLHPLKGVDELIEAMPEEAYLRIVGVDEKGIRKDLERSAREKGLQERILFLGEISDKVLLADEMVKADVLVLPTKSENFGMVIAEALMCSTPVITTKRAPWEGIVEHSCGWWIDPNVPSLRGAMREALSMSRSKLNKMGLNGKEWMKSQFSWDLFFQKISIVFPCTKE